MKYDKKDMMNEGWESMAKMLDQEMPTEKKDRTFLWMFFFVLLAFGSGLSLGQYLQSYKIAKAKKVAVLPSIDHTVGESISSTNFPIQEGYQLPAFANEKVQKVDATNSTDINTPLTPVINHSVITKPQAAIINITEETNGNASQVLSQNRAQHKEMIGFKKKAFDALTSNEIALNYFLFTTNKVKKPRKWHTAIALGTGINLGTQSKVGSIRSELLYQVGKENAIGFELMMAAEDEVYIFRKQPFVLDETETRFAPEQEAVADGKEPIKVYNRTTIPRQIRYGAGLVLSQGIGYKFYANLSAGVDVLKNTYTSDDMPDEVVYRWGGYSSISTGYHLTRHIDFEVSGTKSWSLSNMEGFVPGKINHLVAGLKFSF